MEKENHNMGMIKNARAFRLGAICLVLLGVLFFLREHAPEAQRGMRVEDIPLLAWPIFSVPGLLLLIGGLAPGTRLGRVGLWLTEMFYRIKKK